MHDGAELLGSEIRQIETVERGLGRGRTLSGGEPNAEERARIEASEGALPATWNAVESIVALRIAEPKTLRSGRRQSQGLRSVTVWRPPNPVPVYSLEGGEDGPVGFAANEELEWLTVLLGSFEGEEGGER